MSNPDRFALIYCRVSTSRQERWSPAGQERALVAHAEREGWRYEVHHETGSGETISGRPVFRSLLERIAAGGVGVLLVIEFERLCRAQDLAELAKIKTVCRAAGCVVATPAQALDLSDADDDFLHTLFGALSVREKQKMLARQKRGKAERRAAGKWPGGKAPVGYLFDAATPERLVPDPARADEVRRMLIDAEEHGILTLAKLHPAMSPTTVKLAISRRRLLWYAGRVELPDGRLVVAAWQPLVSLEQALRIDAARGRRSQIRWGGQGQGKRLLTGLGLFRCGHCGRLLASHDRTPGKRCGRYLYYYCRGGLWTRAAAREPCPQAGAFACGPIDRAALWALWRAIPGELSAAEGEPRGQGDADPGPGSAELAEIESSRGRLVAAIEAGVLTIEDARDRVADLTARAARIRARMAQERLPALALPDDLRRAAEEPPAAVPVGAARRLLLAFARRVELHDRRRLTITLRSGRVVRATARA